MGTDSPEGGEGTQSPACCPVPWKAPPIRQRFRELTTRNISMEDLLSASYRKCLKQAWASQSHCPCTSTKQLSKDKVLQAQPKGQLPRQGDCWTSQEGSREVCPSTSFLTLAGSPWSPMTIDFLLSVFPWKPWVIVIGSNHVLRSKIQSF